MGWLEDAIAALESSESARLNEKAMARPSFLGPMDQAAVMRRANEAMPYPAGGDPMTAGGVMPGGPGLPMPYPMAGDPMTAGGASGGGPVPDMAAAQARERILASNPAFNFPINPPGPQLDTALMATPGDWSPFPAPPPGPPPGMMAQEPVPGLMPGQAPFSIAGAPSPSLVQAKAMAAPPPPPPPAPPPPGPAPGGPAPPVVAQGGDDTMGGVGPTDASAARRGPPGMPAPAPMGMAAPVALPGEPQKPFVDRLAALGPGLVALGAGLSGHGWEASRELGKTNQALALQAQQGTATARLLASKGASGAEIQAAVAGGPDTLKALLGQYLTKDKYSVVQTGEDKYGGKSYKLLNSSDGTVKEIQAGSAEDAKAQAQRDELEGVTGAARMEALKATDPAYAKKVQAAVNGDLSLPTGRAALSKQGQKFIEDVLGVDGTVSEADFKIRQQVRKNYTSGKDFQVTKSINTVIDHGAQLEKAIEKLNNNNYFTAITNPVRDAFLSQTDPAYIKAKQAFKVNSENFAREMDFALSGGRPTVSGAQHQREAFDTLAAQVGQKEALRKSIELLDARLREHQRGYEEAIVPGVAKGILPHLEPKTEAFIKRILGNEAPAAKEVKPGNYVYKNGVLVPE